MIEFSSNIGQSLKKNWFVLCSMVVLLVALGFLSSQPVAAGTNGQQLKINLPLTWTSVVVTGTNQYGRTATWRASNNSFINIRSVTYTTGWWWKGTVKIVASKGWNNSTRTCYVVVPKDQGRNDWTTATCKW